MSIHHFIKATIICALTTVLVPLYAAPQEQNCKGDVCTIPTTEQHLQTWKTVSQAAAKQPASKQFQYEMLPKSAAKNLSNTQTKSIVLPQSVTQPTKKEVPVKPQVPNAKLRVKKPGSNVYMWNVGKNQLFVAVDKTGKVQYSGSAIWDPKDPQLNKLKDLTLPNVSLGQIQSELGTGKLID